MPLNRSASAAPRSAAAVGDHDLDAAPRGQVLGDQLGHLARPHDQHAGAAQVAQPLAHQLGGDGCNRRVRAADRGLVRTRLPASSASWNSRLETVPVDPISQGVLVGLADLGQDLGLARHQRVEAAGHLEQVLGRVAALAHVQQRLERALAAVRVVGQPPQRRLAHRLGIRPHHVQLAAVAGGKPHRLDHRVLGDHRLDQPLPVSLRRQLLAHRDRGMPVAGADQQQVHLVRHRWPPCAPSAPRSRPAAAPSAPAWR